ncbi:type III pantothenate kinase [Hymenobacter sp. 15J16-1T3B]|uniref:type III pantothenate kinase n=1 Tax=Hymenobacter sp. 15J16-1T3B TaxID=2886941 RepID=UPI001D10A9C2|nr:type III pantothenate kinase [Hymenobacter sp. 15J16-1T3B]MCC3156078.1 type III pantothenate kinase [Hymenobacter sp. 15J16-1T3B]
MISLVLDIGNTAAKYGCFDGAALAEAGSVASVEELRTVLRRTRATHVLLASVAVPAEEWAAALAGEELAQVLVFKPGTTPVPLTNAYATPHTLGADRLAAAVGAAYLLPARPVVVIDAGTCIKCDLVTPDATYRGGSIAPGLRMRLQAMHAFTGRLPDLPLPAAAEAVQLALCGNDTRTAMLSGALNGAALEVNGMIASYRAEYPALAVVLTGGDAAFFESRLKGRIFAVSELVLLGLHRILVLNVG